MDEMGSRCSIEGVGHDVSITWPWDKHFIRDCSPEDLLFHFYVLKERSVRSLPWGRGGDVVAGWGEYVDGARTVVRWVKMPSPGPRYARSPQILGGRPKLFVGGFLVKNDHFGLFTRLTCYLAEICNFAWGCRLLRIAGDHIMHTYHAMFGGQLRLTEQCKDSFESRAIAGI